MTKQECAVIMAHTGAKLLDGDDMVFFYEYVDYLFDRHIPKCQIKNLYDKIKELSQDDFKLIIENSIDMEEIFDDFVELLSDDIAEINISDEEFEYDDVKDKDGENESHEFRCDNDNVNHPKHYQTKSGIEAIDLIEAFTENLYGIEAVCTGNILKYMCRWKEKNGIEDVRKAEWYIKKLINCLEKDKD